MSRYLLQQGDVAEVLRTLPDNSIDALFCDPPYGFSFMGKSWDYDVPSVAIWAECLRVLKPGAPLLAFGGSRTYHRLVCGIEDAGFELRDCLMWLHGKGFPKSLDASKALDKAAGATREVIGRNEAWAKLANKQERQGTWSGESAGFKHPERVGDITAPATDLAKQWQGYGTALKPAHEPVCLARKPLEGTLAENIQRWGVGPIAIDACRIGESGGTTKGNPPKGASVNAYGNGLNGACDIVDIGAGRWPANLLLDEHAAELLDAQSGERVSRPAVTRNGGGGKIMAGITGKVCACGKPTPYTDWTVCEECNLKRAKPDSGYSDSGGASRFFFTSKASRKEREKGCEHLPLKSAGEVCDREEDSAGLDNPRAGAGRTGGARNHHPTVKPLDLVTYLARLIRPALAPNPDAVILVPFAGSGSEMIGALRAGWPLVFGIEREAEYIDIAHARLAAHVPGVSRAA